MKFFRHEIFAIYGSNVHAHACINAQYYCTAKNFAMRNSLPNFPSALIEIFMQNFHPVLMITQKILYGDLYHVDKIILH